MTLTLFVAHPFRLRIFLLLFVWVVVVSLSSADLFDLQDDVAWPPTDLQVALESDLEEARDDAALARIDVERSDESLSVQSSLVRASLSSVRGFLQTQCLLSKLSVYRV